MIRQKVPWPKKFFRCQYFKYVNDICFKLKNEIHLRIYIEVILI